MDPAYAAAIGVDTDALLLSQPDYGEQALEIADLLVRSGEVALVVIDSVAALVPKAELEGAMGDQTVGLQARMMGQAMRKLAGHLREADATCLFTNQLREKIGVVYGPKETQPGGRALKFYASQRLDIRRIETLKDGERVGRQPGPGQGGEEQGRRALRRGRVRHRLRARDLARSAACSTSAVEHGVVKRSGAYFAYGEERLGQGRAKAKALLEERPELVEAIAREVRQQVEGEDVLPVSAAPEREVVEEAEEAETSVEPGVEAEPRPGLSEGRQAGRGGRRCHPDRYLHTAACCA